MPAGINARVTRDTTIEGVIETATNSIQKSTTETPVAHTKAYNTALRTTDIKEFKKLSVGLDKAELNDLNDALVNRKANARAHINLLKNWYISGRVSEAVYDKLCAKFPSVARGNGRVVTETTPAGKKRKIWINPDALGTKSPDSDLQLVKVLQGSTMPAAFKEKLIKADEEKYQARTRALFLNKSNVPEADKKRALEEYDQACNKFDTVVGEVERATGIISDVKTAAEKLLIVIKKDLEGRYSRHESIFAGATERTKWIASIVAYRDRNAAYQDFVTTCKKLGIDYDVLRPRNIVIPKRKIKALRYGEKSKQYLEVCKKNNAEADARKKDKTPAAKPETHKPAGVPTKPETRAKKDKAPVPVETPAKPETATVETPAKPETPATTTPETATVTA